MLASFGYGGSGSCFSRQAQGGVAGWLVEREHVCRGSCIRRLRLVLRLLLSNQAGHKLEDRRGSDVTVGSNPTPTAGERPLTS